MKQHLWIGCLILSIFSLTGCASRGNVFPQSDLTEEHWMQSVDNNTDEWAVGADKWFLTGDPDATEEMHSSAPDSAAISTIEVRVPNFSNIKVEGPFQVQLFGTDEHNTVQVFGANQVVRQVAVSVYGDTLFARMVNNEEGSSIRQLNRAIIRIGVRNLNNLAYSGSGRLEGRQLRSNSLTITSAGSGNIYLAGDVNLRQITQAGSGCINVFGAITSELNINTANSGDVNVSGNVGIRSIKHHGSGNINIIGANTDGLNVYADGSGKIGIQGRANVHKVVAKEKANVYIYSSVGQQIRAYLSGAATVGIAGYVNELYVDTTKYSRFMGRNLCTMDAYVRAHDLSHVNVTASNRIYAAATQNGSVYFFGTQEILSQFLRGSGTIIPIWFDRQTACMASMPTYKGGLSSRHIKPHQYVSKKKRPTGEKGEAAAEK